MHGYETDILYIDPNDQDEKDFATCSTTASSSSAAAPSRALSPSVLVAGGLDGSAAAEERDNYHRDAYMNDRNHASGAPRPGRE